MSVRWAWLVVVLQVALLAFMAGEREWIYRTGTPLRLRTAPVDPLDPMRGAYVHLDYEIAHVPADRCHDALADWIHETSAQHPRHRDAVVYATVAVNEAGVAEVTALSDRRPEQGLFLRGRIDAIGEDHVRVRYGVEALFLEQAAALQLEDAARSSQRGAPLNTFVAVGRNGVAVMHGYEWEPLSLTVQPVWAEPAPAPAPGAREVPARRLVGLDVEWKNHGEQPVAIVAGPDALRLIPNERATRHPYQWVGAGQPLARAVPEDVRLLPPGATHQVRLDLASPAWFVTTAEGWTGPVADVERSWAVSFSVEYTPPAAAQRATLPHSELIRPGRLRSAAFTPGGGID